MRLHEIILVGCGRALPVLAPLSLRPGSCVLPPVTPYRGVATPLLTSQHPLTKKNEPTRDYMGVLTSPDGHQRSLRDPLAFYNIFTLNVNVITGEQVVVCDLQSVMWHGRIGSIDPRFPYGFKCR